MFITPYNCVCVCVLKCLWHFVNGLFDNKRILNDTTTNPLTRTVLYHTNIPHCGIHPFIKFSVKHFLIVFVRSMNRWVFNFLFNLPDNDWCGYVFVVPIACLFELCEIWKVSTTIPALLHLPPNPEPLLHIIFTPTRSFSEMVPYSVCAFCGIFAAFCSSFSVPSVSYYKYQGFSIITRTSDAFLSHLLVPPAQQCYEWNTFCYCMYSSLFAINGYCNTVPNMNI